MISTLSSFGWLVPVWILGAPLVVGLVGLMVAPKVDHRSTYADPRARSGLQGNVVGQR